MDVPHGEVRERWYFSKTTQSWRRIFVYTPPDEAEPGRGLPSFEKYHGAVCRERESHSDPRLFFSSFRR